MQVEHQLEERLGQTVARLVGGRCKRESDRVDVGLGCGVDTSCSCNGKGTSCRVPNGLAEAGQAWLIQSLCNSHAEADNRVF